jgi:hypothetical protein
MPGVRGNAIHEARAFDQFSKLKRQPEHQTFT